MGTVTAFSRYLLAASVANVLAFGVIARVTGRRGDPPSCPTESSARARRGNWSLRKPLVDPRSERGNTSRRNPRTPAAPRIAIEHDRRWVIGRQRPPAVVLETSPCLRSGVLVPVTERVPELVTEDACQRERRDDAERLRGSTWPVSTPPTWPSRRAVAKASKWHRCRQR
jgi:hypothetical protein